ncbi:MAG: RloB family protein [Lachnospiraceae bacterium]|nr:RloB family protein [Lachnospiraceae bacterium]
MNRPETKARRPKLLCIIGCEGVNQERLYFDKVQNLVNSIETRTCDLLFDFAEPFGGDPKCVVQRVVTKSIGKQNKGAVFDYDGKRVKYEEAIDLAMENQIMLGYTNYCFDLWLILHKEDFFDGVNSQDDYAGKLRQVYGLRRGANIKKKEQVELILEQIDIEDIKTAIVRAELIESINLAKEANKTPQNHEYHDNPDTQMHNMLKVIFQKVGVIKAFEL